MLVASVTTLFEAIVNDDRKNFTGLVEDPSVLLEPDTLAKLDRSIQGVFCFLAFHPRFDAAVFDYVCSPSFPTDTGSHVLALFTVEESALTPQVMGKHLAENWLSLEESNYPAYEIVNKLFVSDRPPALPGVLIAHRLAEPSEPVYVPLRRELKGDQLAAFMRSLFLYADEGYRRSVRESVPFAPKLGTVLAREGISYMRISPLLFSEWLFKSINFVRSKGGDIVTVVKFAAGLVSKEEKD
jgi:hypothetical protein